MTTWKRTVRFTSIATAALLIVAGTLLLTGCLFIPTFNVTTNGTNVAAKVGYANSWRPFRVGIATRQQIEAMFGPAPYRDEPGRRIGYAWSVLNGVWVYPFCFAGIDQTGNRGIELDFDEHDILRRFHIVSADPEAWSMGWSNSSGRTRRPPFDSNLHPNNSDEENRWRNVPIPPELKSTTTPTTTISAGN